MAEPTDPLLAKARRGDHAALDELCRREWRPLYGLLYRAVRHPAEAQELTQEVFLRALPALGRFRVGDSPFRAFLATIARNLLRDRWRRRAPAFVGLDGAAEVPAAAGDPVEQALLSAERARLWRAFATLPAEHQRVLRLRIVEGRPAAEVGAALGRSPAAIRQMQHRALVALRDRLQQEAPG